MPHRFDSIRTQLHSEPDKRIKIALVWPSKELVEAMQLVVSTSPIDPVIIGDAEVGVAHDFKAVPADDPVSAVGVALDMAGKNEVKAIFLGYLEQRDRVDALVAATGKKPLAHIAVVDTDKYSKLLFVADAGINVAPDIKGKLGIISHAVGLATIFEIEMPKVAMMAAVEVIYPGMRVTEEGAVISKMVDKKQITNCFIDGPLSMDVATVPEVAEQKGATSDVAGQADILIAPNIETAAGIYKALSMYVPSCTAGIVMGAPVPIGLPSRCDKAESLAATMDIIAWLGR